jgi:hypothetical protein
MQTKGRACSLPGWRAQLGNRLAIFSNQDALPGARNLIHQREAFRLEFRRLYDLHDCLLTE